MGFMSLFSKSGSKSTELPTDVRSGFIGKIPARPDFVRHQAGGTEIKLLDQWMHEGIAYLARRFPADWKDRLDGFAHIYCYIAGEGSIPTFCGVIRSSRDKSGRQHPFVEFVTCSSTQAMLSLPFISLRFSEFLKHGGNLLDETGSDLDVDKLIMQSSALVNKVPAFFTQKFEQQLTEYWAGKTAAEFWEIILPGSNASTRISFSRDILQTLKMAANRGPERIAWGVRLPIPTGDESDSIVAFWLRMFVSVLGNQKWRPHVFWNPKSKGGASLTLYFRSPNASSFAQLICPEVDEGGVVDVLRRPLENLPEITSVRLKNLVENGSLTWPEMLENWVKG